MFFWHRNKIFSECELCNFSINLQEGIFFTSKKIQIYLSSCGEKNIQSVYQSIWQATPHTLTVLSHTKSFWASFLTLFTDFTQDPWLCSSAAAGSHAAQLLPHFVLQHRTDHLCTTCWDRQEVRNLAESVYMVLCIYLIVSLIFHSLESEWMVLQLLSLN